MCHPDKDKLIIHGVGPSEAHCDRNLLKLLSHCLCDNST